MITILMASYNGERFIAEQIESLLSQTEQNFTLHIHDDCSTDKTWQILCDFSAKYPQKIIVHKNETNSGGAKWNFLQMLLAYQDEYVMLCDQDDVWLPNKIEITLSAMQKAQASYGDDAAILVHTDLAVVDEKLQQIHASFREMSHLDYQRVALKDQLVQNTMTGCTAMLNKQLQAYVKQLPDYCIMHDWWLMLIAASFGHIVTLDQETPILYRQHSSNAIGAKNTFSLSFIYERVAHSDNTRVLVNQTYRQAESFYNQYGEQLSAEKKDLIKAYCEIPKHKKLKRLYDVCHLKTYKHGFLRILGQFFYI